MKVSIVCPFYNESGIIENAVKGLQENLTKLDFEWEAILVNDGSTDDSFELAKAAATDPRIRVVGYNPNHGRGFALRYGAANASGDILVTTEIDLSWGDDIVERLVKVFEDHPDADVVIASPHLPGGGYRNVPAKRVFYSSFGNKILRMGQSYKVTMYTGMTRAYRREAFLTLPVDENEKEFHLEVAQKALAFGFSIYEIPCILEWKDNKLAKPKAKKRKSSSRIPKLIRSHLIFALFSAPFRYVIPFGIVLMLMATGFLIWGFVNLALGIQSVNLAIISAILYLFGFLVIAIGVLSYQIRNMQHDIWRVRSCMRCGTRPGDPNVMAVMDIQSSLQGTCPSGCGPSTDREQG